jgi:hypothetical protein
MLVGELDEDWCFAVNLEAEDVDVKALGGVDVGHVFESESEP